MPGLFGGARFFLSHAIPQRSRLKETIERNGGVVVLLEQDADTILVDHLRKTQTLPANALSYQFVEKSVQNGRLEDPESYRVGPSSSRPMGASNIPAKSTRRSYSLEDDRIVFDWLYPLEQAKGAPTHGNNIYKQLAARFPQHTWQSWRTRYLKTLRGKPRPGGGQPRPDLVYGGPEAVPRIEQPSQPPQTSPEGSQAPLQEPTLVASREPTKSAARQSNQASPEISSRKRGPPSVSSPDLLEAAKKAKKRSADTTQSPTPPVQPLFTHSEFDSVEPVRICSNEAPSLDRGADSEIQDTIVVEDSTVPVQPPETPADIEAEPSTDALFLQLPFFPTSSDSDSSNYELREGDDSDPEEYSDIGSWIKAQEARGVDISTVLDALRFTSMEPAIAKKLLRVLESGNPLPQNMRGVWTEEDDRCLGSQDAHEVQRVLMKHGDKLLQARWEYLEMARERGLVE
ncbi:hypothetical protein PDE_08895 [Penicillium oxalicum 114-2]|uniref:DNA-binding protein RAP1 n=1 Tax=Penicillium oxalicum (strain 114-2 / CGMCC 5302) TaxID=933388 RepID=S8B521_PENO1|nr:hypothetical protein PDE_08895 [Penicillium oxalicum 114-2]